MQTGPSASPERHVGSVFVAKDPREKRAVGGGSLSFAQRGGTGMSPPDRQRNVPSKVPTERTGKSYLVIGGQGFLGSHLVEALLARGEDRVRILVRSPSQFFAREQESGRIEFVRGDVRD